MSLFYMLLLEEIANGGGMSLGQAARQMPGRGKPSCSPSCAWRWVVDGLKLRNGKRVKLEAMRLGTRFVTSRGAIARFLAACGQAEMTEPTSDADFATNEDLERIFNTSTAQKRAAAAAAKLAAIGA